MSITDNLSPQLVMKRDHLDDLPPLALPEGYTLRSYREGDGPCWARILNESFGGSRTAEDFLKIMVEHPAFRPDRLFFVCDLDGVPCATAGAYRSAEWGAATGYVHYVATRPCHAGKKLGYIASLAVLYKFREEGCPDAVLQTDDFRLAAIKTYLRLGFHPHAIHENQPERWRKVLAEITTS